MGVNLRLPNITGLSEKEQILQIKNYLYQLVGELQFALSGSGSASSSVVLPRQSSATVAPGTSIPYTDFVIEQGTSDGWTYRKWKKGTYEMFGEFEIEPGTSILNGSVYCTSSIAIKAPFAIKSAMVSGTAVGFYWISNGDTSGTNAVNIRIISDKTISAASITVRLHAVGTYA